jgi:hypothetical protein
LHRRETDEERDLRRLTAKDRYKRTLKQKQLANALLVYHYLLEHPCVDCGETDPIVLEFDHNGDKFMTVSAMKVNYSQGKLLAEIAKCEVRCVKCHRRRHFIENNTLMVQLVRNGGSFDPE